MRSNFASIADGYNDNESEWAVFNVMSYVFVCGSSVHCFILFNGA